MAAVKAGTLPASCIDCKQDPQQKEYWGCGKDGNIQWQDIHTGDIFHTCPIQFVKQDVYSYLEEVDYIKTFPTTARPYKKNTRKWIDGMYYYNNAFETHAKAAKGRSINE